MRRLILLLVLLVGCYADPPLRALSAEEELVYYAWLACWPPEWETDCNLDELSVMQADAATYAALCPANSWACTQWRWVGLDHGDYVFRYPVIVLSPASLELTLEQRPRLELHELEHAAGACAGLWEDVYDYGHTDTDVWAPTGVEACSQEML